MANTLLTADMITKEALYLLENSLTFVKLLDNRSKDINQGGTGYSTRIRKPANFETVQANDVTSSIKDIVEEYVTLTVDSAPISIPIEILDSDLALSIEDFSGRILRPAMESLASKIENEAMVRILPAINNVVNGAAMTFDLLADVRTRMNEKSGLINSKSRKIILTSGQSAQLRKDTKSLNITPDQAFTEGALGNVGGFDLFESELLPTHTCGSRAATGHSVTTTSDNGDSTIALTLAASTTIKKGDTFTVAGCYNVNYTTKVQKSTLYQFTAAADVAAGTSVTVTLTQPIWGPAATGYRQKMSKLPTATDAVTFVGAASSAAVPQAIAFDPLFAACAFVELPVHTKSVEDGSMRSYKGISIRYQKDYALGTNKNLVRLDVQPGFVVVQPEYACRFLSVA